MSRLDAGNGLSQNRLASKALSAVAKVTFRDTTSSQQKFLMFK